MRTWLWLSLAVAWPALLACNKTPPAGDGPSPSAAPSAAAAPSASAAAPAKPWYAGTWAGEYTAKAFKVENEPGAVKEWIKDDGTKASGPGKLTLRIAVDGSIEGESEGALGALQASGLIDGETVRVSLRASPEATRDTPSFSGTLIGSRKGDVIEGRVQASSGDSLTVREASFALAKQEP